MSNDILALEAEKKEYQLQVSNLLIDFALR
jgi:hypothetical protein